MFRACCFGSGVHPLEDYVFVWAWYVSSLCSRSFGYLRYHSQCSASPENAHDMKAHLRKVCAGKCVCGWWHAVLFAIGYKRDATTAGHRY